MGTESLSSIDAVNSEYSGNCLLDAMTLDDRRRMRPFLELEHVEAKQVLYEPGAARHSAYFPVTSVVSFLSRRTGGSRVEIMAMGNEGMVGARIVFGQPAMPPRWDCQVEMAGEMLRMDQMKFAELIPELGSLRQLLPIYFEVALHQIGQQVVCNASHSVEERCCRWLLLTHDRVRNDRFPVTQDFLAKMLGVRRASVTLTAIALQNAGLIRYSRGQLEILDHDGLEKRSCECYCTLREEFDRIAMARPLRA